MKHKLTGNAVFLLLFLVMAATPAAGRRPVQRQGYDQSCALASLGTLLSWGGTSVDEQRLLAELDVVTPRGTAARRRLEDGVTASQLILLAGRLDPTVRLIAELRTPQQVQTLAEEEVFLLYLLDGGGSGLALRHFTVIDGYIPSRGFVRADPVDGRHVVQPAKSLFEAGLQWRDRSRMLVLRALRGTMPLVVPEPVSDDPSDIPYLAEARTLAAAAAIPDGRTLVSLTATLGEISSPRVEGLRLTSLSRSMALSVTHGIGGDAEFTATIPFGSERASLSFRRGGIPAVDLARSRGPGAPIFAWSQRIPQAFGPSIQTAVTASFRPWGHFGLGVTGATAAGPSTLFEIGVDMQAVRGRGHWHWGGSLSVSATQSLSSSWQLSAQAAMAADLEQLDLWQPRLGVGLARRLGRSWEVSAFASRTFSAGRGYSSMEGGLAVSFLLPRSIRR
jgi:hypothetical protein